jgi:hypothetical protein
MKIEQEKLVLIASRIPPGDRWQLEGDTFPQASLTDALEAYYQKTGQACEYRLAPLKGKLYAIAVEQTEVIPEPPKKYNIYGDYE